MNVADSSGSSSTSGWDAIAAIFAKLHPETEPVHRAPTAGLAFGGPVEGISAYPAADHWHFVTYALSELYAKESDDPSLSGFGYELTLRVPRTRAEVEPPSWAFTLLASIAAAQWQGNDFAAGHRLATGGPITGSEPCRLVALAFTPAPQLPALETPNGRLEFLQLVGITREELAEMQATTTDDVLRRLAAHDPHLITDPTR